MLRTGNHVESAGFYEDLGFTFNYERKAATGSEFIRARSQPFRGGATVVTGQPMSPSSERFRQPYAVTGSRHAIISRSVEARSTEHALL
jgi:hypothetical protein